MTESVKPPEIVADGIRGHVMLIHMLAKPFTGRGKVIATGFGEDPNQPDPKTGKPGRHLPPQVIHADAGDVKATLGGIAQFVKRPHYNLYMPLAIYGPDLRPGAKGAEQDIVACLGLVADFDDAKAAQWAERLPIPPNYVLETSAGRFQAFYLFDKPEAPEVVKPVAERLKVFARCDHGTSDISHVWRVSGALNWPNAKKVAEGRAPDPQLVRVAKWDDSRTSLQALSDVLPEGDARAERKERASTSAAGSLKRHDQTRGDQSSDARVFKALVATFNLPSLPSELQDEIERPAVGDRSKALFRVIAKMIEQGLDDEAIENFIRAYPKGIGEKYADRDDLDREIARIREKTTAPSPDDEIISLVSAMNKEYAVVDDNGKTVVIYRREDTDLKRKYVVRSSYQDFRNLYLNARVEPSDVYNLWTGWGIDPQPGDWPKMMAHIKDVLCSGSPEYFDYVMNWLARAVQKPGEAGEVALVLRGARGAGKGIFARTVGVLFGQHFLHLSNARHLTGNFNAHLRDACLVFADEAFYAGDKQHEGQLKRLVTEPTLMIEAKYANAVAVRNCLHLIVASNDEWVVPAGTDERRFFVLDVSPIRRSDFAYFETLEKELKNGGSSAMLHDLLRRDISGFNVRSVPDTAGLSDQKIRSLRGIEAWWYETLEEGKIVGVASDDGVFASMESDWTETVKVNRDTLYHDYVDFSKERREYRPEDKSQLGKCLRRYIPGLTEERPRQPGTTHRDRLYVLPPLNECRAAFEKVIGSVDWENM